jgi:hypothetical protein
MVNAVEFEDFDEESVAEIEDFVTQWSELVKQIGDVSPEGPLPLRTYRTLIGDRLLVATWDMQKEKLVITVQPKGLK